jgi:hypothetical protein
MTLLVPPPVLTQDSATGTKFGFDKPIELRSTGITFPDGRPLVLDNMLASGFLLYRETQQGAVATWDEEARSWVASVPAPEPQPLLYHEDVWKSILVAIGETDAQKNDKFEQPSSPPLPTYYVRCFYQGKDVHGQRHEGESPPSNLFQLDRAAAQQNELAGIVIEPPDLQKAKKVQVFLKHYGPLQQKAELTLESKPAGVSAMLAVGSNNVTIDATGVRVTGPIYINGSFLPWP